MRTGAVEAVTGEHINGVLFDDQGLSTARSSGTEPGRDNMGGQWTYTVKKHRVRRQRRPVREPGLLAPTAFEARGRYPLASTYQGSICRLT
jgi:hypothetical protein